MNVLTRRWLPPATGVLLILLFASLAQWQLDRAAEKKALAERFSADTEVEAFDPAADYPLYRPVRLEGVYWSSRQFLLDNIVQDGRPGYYVVTPFRPRGGGPLLLVNRGWIPGGGAAGAGEADIGIDEGPRRVRGRIGRLPQVAIRPGEAIPPGQDWPLEALYPTREELAAALGEPLLEPVLLLAPDEADGFRRDWRPRGSGPMMHYGYAFQWSALAVTVLVILVWQLKKRYRRG